MVNAADWEFINEPRPSFLREISPPDARGVSSSRKKVDLPDDLKNRIRAFVAAHLFPYITGDVSRETEPASRQAMMDMLLKKVHEKDPDLSKKLDKKIQKFALQ